MENGGWVKLFRKTVAWEWFTDVNTAHFFLYCLLKANDADRRWKGIEVKRGSFVSSISRMSVECGLSAQSVRTSINKLKSTNELTSESTNEFTLITICNYENYQCAVTNEQQTNQQANQQTANKRLTNEQQTKKNFPHTPYKNIQEDEEEKEDNNKTFTDVKVGEIEISPVGKDEKEDENFVEFEEIISKKKSSAKRKKYTPEESRLHAECREFFEAQYKELKNEDFYWQAKDGGALVGILTKIRYYMPEEQRGDCDMLLNNFKAFVSAIAKHGDAFQQKKFNLPYINGYFNEIYTTLKTNGNGNGNKNSNIAADSEYIAGIIADLQS